MAQGDVDTAHIKLQQALTILRSATQQVFNVERSASDGSPTDRDALILNHACSVDLREARIMLEAAESLACDAYEAVFTAR